MHIALYSPNWPPAGAANGIVSYVSTVRDHLVGKGHKVTILSDGRLYPSGRADAQLLAPMERLGSLGRLRRRVLRRLDNYHGGLPGLGWQLAAQISAAHHIDPIDIVEMEESFGWSDTVQRLTGIPVVTRLHGPYFLKPAKPRTIREGLNDRQRVSAEGRAVRSSHTLTAPIRTIMNVTCERYGRARREHDAVIPNPIRLAPETARWNLRDCDRNRILMVGRFDYWKGADTMMLAFEQVLRSYPDAQLTLVGPLLGIEMAPGRIAGFEEYARANLSPETARRIEIAGILTPAEIARLRQKAFVTVVASRGGETFSYALVEGLAAGSPMISTDWPGSDEIIRHGESGFLTPVGDANALAERLGWMFDHPEIASQVGENGMRHCASAFSIEMVGSRLIECYDDIICNRAK